MNRLITYLNQILRIFKTLSIYSISKNLSFFVLSANTFGVSAQLRLPSVYSSNMVLQQQSKVKLWGWASPLDEVSVISSWDNAETKTKTPASDAQWEVVLNTPKAGGPYSITIKGSGSSIVLENILIGEVWLCSGQSNMQWQAAAGINNAKEEIANANYPQIRLFNTQRIAADFPQLNCFGTWSVCSPQTMKDFSAVGYFFGRRLQTELNVPIGLINSSWGGSPIEIWMREEVVNANEALRIDAAKRIPEWSPVKPGAAYNSMISPFLSMPIAGVIWYQGESNVDHPNTYAMLMKNLIESWRADWKLNFPFYYVQLAPCHYNGGKYQAALLREQQTKALQIVKTGMVVTTDLVKDTNNIHPTNKQDVGLRLANLALTETYEKQGVVSKSPMFKSYLVNKNKIILTFDNVLKGFKVDGKEITGFQIAGEDRKFVTASAKINNNTIIVYHKDIKTPSAVRFGFENASVPNLFSAGGLPVAPFRTDDWAIKE